MFNNLTVIQINVLLASIIGDGELTKLYKGSRRKNSSYREHFGDRQREYREWKAQLMNDLFYITHKSNSLRSASNPLFTNLLGLFYNNDGNKSIPATLLPYCNLSHFLAVLYMDDGSLSITAKVNHNNNKIYITPHIYLYLQNYPSLELTLLKNHIKKYFQIDLKLASRKDGHGFILRTTSVNETFSFLNKIRNVSDSCPSMFYKTNWNYRLQQESEKWKLKLPDYKLVVSSSDRWKNYSSYEIKRLVVLKKEGHLDKEIANLLGRSYWSVVYKLRELRKLQLL
ncbi:DNA endonuclease [Bacillus sp. 1P10SD]|uniref:DNA endonuclease n=1 Tax=Bacillus sp. 1P10SD TaxID=3132265 RepID=UPI0039A6887A